MTGTHTEAYARVTCSLNSKNQTTGPEFEMTGFCVPEIPKEIIPVEEINPSQVALLKLKQLNIINWSALSPSVKLYRVVSHRNDKCETREEDAGPH